MDLILAEHGPFIHVKHPNRIERTCGLAVGVAGMVLRLRPARAPPPTVGAGASL